MPFLVQGKIFGSATTACKFWNSGKFWKKEAIINLRRLKLPWNERTDKAHSKINLQIK